MKVQTAIILFSLFLLVICGTAFSDQTIIAVKTTGTVPFIDGFDNDPIWQRLDGIVTHADRANIDVKIKAVRTDKVIFFLVRFPDENESRSQKALHWNKKIKMYELGPEREDCFIFKWNMEPKKVDLSVYADEGYETDIWFWKAGRTDPAGFADDKRQILSKSLNKKCKKITSKSGKTMYFQRISDTGKSAYSADIPIEYKGGIISQYKNRQPQGSRADIKAKGNWRDGKWIIEFCRALDTGHNDDVSFTVGKKYQFGIAISEIADKKPDIKSEQPLYGSDDISENIYLEIK